MEESAESFLKAMLGITILAPLFVPLGSNSLYYILPFPAIFLVLWIYWKINKN